MKAASVGMGDVVTLLLDARLLLDVRCDHKHVDKNGRNILQMAVQSGKTWLVAHLQGRFPELDLTQGKGRPACELTRGQIRVALDNEVEHPQGKKGKRKGYEPAGKSDSSASESAGEGKRHRGWHT